MFIHDCSWCGKPCHNLRWLEGDGYDIIPFCSALCLTVWYADCVDTMKASTLVGEERDTLVEMNAEWTAEAEPVVKAALQELVYAKQNVIRQLDALGRMLENS